MYYNSPSWKWVEGAGQRQAQTTQFHNIDSIAKKENEIFEIQALYHFVCASSDRVLCVAIQPASTRGDSSSLSSTPSRKPFNRIIYKIIHFSYIPIPSTSTSIVLAYVVFQPQPAQHHPRPSSLTHTPPYVLSIFFGSFDSIRAHCSAIVCIINTCTCTIIPSRGRHTKSFRLHNVSQRLELLLGKWR